MQSGCRSDSRIVFVCLLDKSDCRGRGIGLPAAWIGAECTTGVTPAGEETVDKVRAVEPSQRVDDVGTIGLVPPEKVFSLGEFLFGAGGGIDLFAGIGMDTGIVDLGSEGHRSRSKVLYLLEMEIHVFGLGGKFGHIYLATTGVRRYEVGDKLLTQTGFMIDTVEYPREIVIEFKRWLAHKFQYMGAGVLRGYFQTSRYMMLYQFAIVAAVGLVNTAVAGMVHRQVVAYAAADK